MIWLIFIFSVFGITIVTTLMGICLLFERRFQRMRMKPIIRDTWWVLKAREEAERERLLTYRVHELSWRDFGGFWSIVTLAMLLMVPLVAWTLPPRIDLLLVFHPIALYGWWSHMRSNGVRHAEVYVVTVWMLGHVSWLLAFLAPYRDSVWNLGEWDLIAETSELFSTTPLVVQVVVVALIVTALASAIASLLLARLPGRPRVALIMIGAAWIPIAYLVWLHGSIIFGLGLFMTVGVAGYGISREVRRLRDSAARLDLREGRSPQPADTNGSFAMPLPLGVQLGLIVLVAVASAASFRYAFQDERAIAIAATWTAVILASAAGFALVKHKYQQMDGNRIAVAASIATVFGLAMLTNAVWSFDPIYGEEVGIDGYGPFDLVPPQATILGFIALGAFALAFIKHKIREYGAMLLGFMFVPTAHYLADLHVQAEFFVVEGRYAASLHGIGIVIVTILAGATLFIMWRVFGPNALGETELDESVDHDTPRPTSDAT